MSWTLGSQWWEPSQHPSLQQNALSQCETTGGTAGDPLPGGAALTKQVQPLETEGALH